MMSPVHTATPGVNGDVPHGPDHTPGQVSVSHQHPRLHLLAGEVVRAAAPLPRGVTQDLRDDLWRGGQ